MKCVCGRKASTNPEKNVKKSELYQLTLTLRFTEDEVLELRERFNSLLPVGAKEIDKDTFSEKMGLLGLDSSRFLSNRIFGVIDTNRDGQISLEEFLRYFDILVNGEQEEKVELTFFMIDNQRKGGFSFDEFSQLILSILQAWNDITNTQIEIMDNEVLKEQIRMVFQRFDAENRGRVDLQTFKEVVVREPHLLEIFDYASQGFQDSLNPFSELPPRLQMLRFGIEDLELKLTRISNYIQNPEADEAEDADSEEEMKQSCQLQRSQQIITTSKDKPRLFESGIGKISSPLFKKMRNIRGTIFLEPIMHDFDQHSRTKTFTVSRHPYMPPKNGIGFGEADLKASLRPQFKSLRLVDNEKTYLDLSHGYEAEPVDQNISTMRLFRDNSKPKTTSESERPTLQKLEPVLPDETVIDDCFECSIDTKMDSREKLANDSKAAPKMGTFRENQWEKKFFPPMTESVMVSKDNNNNNIDMIKVASKEYFGMKERIFELQDKFEDVLKATQQASEILDEMRKETKHNENRMKHNEKLGYMKIITSHNIPQSKSVVFLGHRNWELVLDIMVGVQMAVKSVMCFSDYEIEPKDFKLKQYFQLVPKRIRLDSKMTKLCTFYDYAPNVFNEIRKAFGIKNQEYLQSIGPESMLNNWIKGNVGGLSELMSSGKSGSLFYYTADGLYTIKTVKKSEFLFLMKILQNYYTYVTQNPQTLIAKFFGCHRIKFQKEGSNTRFEKSYILVMGNVFNTINEIHIRYDIKGSTYGRRSRENDPSIAKKDLDFLDRGEKLQLEARQAEVFMNQISKDAAFFAQNNIIDYSLLIGIHYLNRKTDCTIDWNRTTHYTDRALQNFKDWLSEQEGAKHGGSVSTDGQKLYYFGIIDILTEFNSKKKLEYALKSVIHGSGVSAVPPAKYAQRFLKFISTSVDSQSYEQMPIKKE